MIEEIGTVAERKVQRGNLLLRINASTVLENLKISDSITINGPCLTVTDFDSRSFQVEATAYTVKNSTLSSWNVGRRVNLERALKVGDRLGGHVVQGHVDGIGKISRIRFAEGFTTISVEAAPGLMSLMAPKGSVAIDGVSLTLAEKSSRGFQLMVIPYSLEHTTLGDLRPGDSVNIETDLFIRWLADRFPEGKIAIDDNLNRSFNIDFHLED